MLDLKWIRENPDKLDENLKKRGAEPCSPKIIALDKQHRQCQTELQDLQNQRNALAKAIGQAKQQGQNADAQVAEAATIKERIPVLESELQVLDNELSLILEVLPNILEDEVPVGSNEHDNKVVLSWGTPKSFDFTPQRHDEIGTKLGLMDFESAAKISGSRFVILKGALALLERALGNFMLDLHVQKFGYQEVSPPYLVQDRALFGTGQLPKFGEDLFRTTSDHWLIPTAEVSLTNMVREQIMEESMLPQRFVAHTPCFRSEAGAAGKDTRGMIRQHQFHKVELVSITHPDHSVDEHKRMVDAAEEVLKLLEIPHRIIILCSGDTGIQSRKTYDIEVWLPGEGLYREISSCSNCGDYQARRMMARFRPTDKDGKKSTPQYVHTLNGSGIAVGRALVAVLENYQEKDGTVKIPQVLIPYMNGLERIKAL